MTELFQTKSNLAKLLAQENLVVEHRKVHTASFDLENRTITLPIWKVMDGDLYDLLLGHEVSHGLHTPPMGWHDAVVGNSGLKSFLNVIEDARIERKIKDKYPGLRRSFNNAYKKLHEDDFFALKDRDVSKMLLIDRINIFFKLGAFVNVPFTQEELEIIGRISSIDTWEDVESLARELYGKAKEEQKNQVPDLSIPSDDEDEEDRQGEDNFSDDSYDDFNDTNENEESENGDDESDESDDSDDAEGADESDVENDDQEEESSSDESTHDYNEGQNEEVVSETDKAFRENEKNLIENIQGETHVLNVPTYDMDKVLVPYTKVHHFINQKFIPDPYNPWFDPSNVRAKTYEMYNDLVKRSSPTINYMIKEFEMRKNASQMARAKVGKSGKINPKKLARFNLDRDIFQRITTVSEGKNHGLVIFIDLSGSMTDIIERTFEQAIVLTTFCKKINLPFEVYGFSDDRSKDQFMKDINYLSFKPKDLCVGDSHFHIKQYLSSSMSTKVYRECAANLLMIGAIYKGKFRREMLPITEHLYGTPLDESVIASIYLVNDFKAKHKVDMVNSIFLTDGCGVFNNQYIGIDNKLHNGRYEDVFYIEHKETKHRVKYEHKTKNGHDNFSSTRALIELAKKVTGAKYTGYLIASKRHIASYIYPYEYSHVNWSVERQQQAALREKVAKNGFFASNKHGFDEYFFVLNENLKIEDQKIEVADDAKKGAISRAFMKSLNKRGLQRLFLNKFVQNLAA
jgi:hypothetical protein